MNALLFIRLLNQSSDVLNEILLELDALFLALHLRNAVTCVKRFSFDFD